MELIKTLLEQQPLMALFLTIAIGYLVGEIKRQGILSRRGSGALRGTRITWEPRSAAELGRKLRRMMARTVPCTGCDKSRVENGPSRDPLQNGYQRVMKDWNWVVTKSA